MSLHTNNIILYVHFINCNLFHIMLYSKPPAHVLSTDKGLGTMIQLDITMNNEHMIIYGFGRNKKEAKVAAAKMALKNMEKIM